MPEPVVPFTTRLPTTHVVAQNVGHWRFRPVRKCQDGRGDLVNELPGMRALGVEMRIETFHHESPGGRSYKSKSSFHRYCRDLPHNRTIKPGPLLFTNAQPRNGEPAGASDIT